jgi:hypothetical protein
MTESRLAYADRFQKLYEGTVTTECDGGYSPLVLEQDAENAILLLVTGTEFRKLLACVELGEGLIYPDEQYEVQWSLLRGVECGMEFCGRVAQCIYDSTAVSEALQAWALSQGLIKGAEREIPQIGNSVVATAGAGCDASDKYGLCYEVIGMINQVVVDVFDFLDVYASQAEIAAGIARAVPVVGQYIGAAFDIANFLLSYTSTVYDAAYNETAHQQVSCMLLCHMDGCDITVDGILGALREFLQGFEVPGAFSTLLEFAAWASNVTLSGNAAIVSALMLVIVEIWSRGSEWIGTPANVLQIASQTYTPIDPTGICDACPSPCDEYLGGDDGHEDWPPIAYNGTYATYNAADDRYEAVYAGAGTFNKSAFIEHEFASTPLTSIAVTVEIDSTRGNTGSIWVYADGVAITEEIAVADGEKTLNVPFDGETEYTSVWVLLQARTWADDVGAFAYIKHINFCI